MSRWPWFDIMKWSRPERSGALAVLAAFTLLWMYGEIYIPHDYTDDLRKFSLTCYLFPWALSCEKQPEEAKEQVQKHYHILLLHPGIKANKKVCACHFDMHYFGKAIQHLYFEPLQACDSDYAEPRAWTEPLEVSDASWTGFDGKIYVVHSVFLTYWNQRTGERFEMNHGQGEYRYHCE